MSWKVLRELLVVVVGMGLIFILVRIDHNLEDNNAGLDRNYKTTLTSRAEDCRLQLGLGIVLSKNCLSKEMKPYFDPNEKIQTGSMRVLCQNLHQNEPDQPLPKGCPGA